MPNGEPTEPEAPKAGAATLEGRLSIFDSIGSSLESLVGAVRAIPKVAKEAARYTYYTAKAAAGLAAGVAMGGLPALILPVGMAAGTALFMWKSNEKLTFKEVYKKIANDLAIGGILGGLACYYFTGTNKLANAVQSVYGTSAGVATRLGAALPYVPVFLAEHEYLNRALIKDYKPEPLKDMWKKLKGPMKWIIPLVLANFTVVPYYFSEATRQTAHLTVSATNSALYGLLKEEMKEEKAPAQNQLPQGYAPRPA